MRIKQGHFAVRQRINLSLDRETVAEARALGINISRAVGKALAAEIKSERDRRWREENHDWVVAYNEWFERNGDPLAHLKPL